jgi:fluoride exporter
VSGVDLATVAFGGAVGAVVRWQLSQRNGRLPIGTLVANVGGILLAAVVLGLTDDRTAVLLLVVGLAGGLTTFSTVVVELVQRPPRAALVYALATVVLGSLAMAVGAVVT